MKNWKGYAFEFFLLFLAILAGFLVENLREHYNEKQQIQEYAQLLFEETQIDTMFMKQQQSQTILKITELDSLITLLDNRSSGSRCLPLYQQSKKFLTNVTPIDLKAYVIEYIDIRLFSNADLVNLVFGYRDGLDLYITRRKNISDISNAIFISVQELFDPKWYYASDQEKLKNSAVIFCLTDDKLVWSRFYHRLFSLRKQFEEEQNLLKHRNDQAVLLLALLQKEYLIKQKPITAQVSTIR
jgi:hypothetical protein